MIPNPTLAKELKGEIDYADDTFEALLLKDTTSYSPDRDRDEFVEDVLNNADEYDDTNYGRESVTNPTVNQNNTDDRAEWDADDITWSDLGSATGQTIQAVVIYKLVNDDTDSPVVRVLDDSNESELPISTNGSNVTIQWDATGIRTASE